MPFLRNKKEVPPVDFLKMYLNNVINSENSISLASGWEAKVSQRKHLSLTISLKYS